MPTEIAQPLTFNAAVEALLAEAGLPTSDLRGAGPVRLLGVRRGERLVGVVGVEAHGTVGLLRSLAVAPDCRKAGLGKALVADAQAWARTLGIDTLYLLTTTADKFFEGQGYSAIARAEAPAAIAASAQFAALCPAWSIFMRKALR